MKSARLFANGTALIAALLLPVAGFAADEAPLSKGQALYLPIYSHIWHGNRVVEQRYPLKSLLSALVSIRNTSLKTPIRILSAKYYSTDGKLLKDYLSTPRTVAPMGTFELFVEKDESEGGSGANFLVQWEAATPTNPPLVQAVHADIKGHQTLTFTTTAIPVRLDQ